MKNFFITSFLLAFTWAAAAKIPDGVAVEMQRYTSESGEKLSAEYIQSFALTLLEKSERDEKQFSAQHEKDCVDSIMVDFGQRITETTQAAARSFEDGIVRVEIAKCLENTTPSEVIGIIETSAFRRKAIDSIKVSQPSPTGPGFCEMASTFAGDFSYCSQLEIDESNDRSIQTKSLNYWNDPQKKFKYFYFKASRGSLRQVQNNTLYHYVTYIRGADLNIWIKRLGGFFIKRAQENTIRVLQEELRKSN